MREADRELKRAGADSNLSAHRNVARTGALVHGCEPAVPIAQVDVHVGAPEVAHRGAAERADQADPDVLLLKQQRGRMGVDDVREVAFGTWLPVGRSLHVEAKVRKLRCERRRDEHRVLLGVGEELLGQPVLVMSGLDPKRRDAGADPADAVLPVSRVVNGRRAAGGREETELMQCHVVEEGKEDLAERAPGQRVPELAPGSGRRSERHLASGPPHRGRAWSAGGFHRVLSMERAWGRIESNDGPELSGRWLSGRKHPPAKRVGGVKLPRGFESLPSRSMISAWRSTTSLWILAHRRGDLSPCKPPTLERP